MCVYSYVITYGMRQYNVIVSFWFCFYGKVESSVCLTALWQNGGKTIA